jgi:hypothetical protein
VLVFIDDWFKKNWTYFLKCKFQIFDYFKKFKELIESKTRNKVRILRTYREGEFLSNEFRVYYYRNNGIRREFIQALIP